MIMCKDGGYIPERADKEAELKRMIDRLDHAMGDVQIALNNLRDHFGLDVICVRVYGSGAHEVQLMCGIDELGQVLNKSVNLDTRWNATKEFRYKWVKYLQLAEKNSMKFRPLNSRGKALFRLVDEVKENDHENL